MQASSFPWKSLDENGNHIVELEPAPVEIPRVKCSAAPPLSVLGMALAVLLGNVFTAIVGAVIYAALR
jgi:hypothetical protein